MEDYDFIGPHVVPSRVENYYLREKLLKASPFCITEAIQELERQKRSKEISEEEVDRFYKIFDEVTKERFSVNDKLRILQVGKAGK